MRHVFVFYILLYSFIARGAGEAAQTITLDGTLYSATNFSSPLLDAAASLKIQILNPAKDCVLYEETQVVNTTASSGKFNIQVGSVTGAGKRTGDDPNHAMAFLLQNVSAISATNAGCPGSTYTPASGDVRYLRVELTPSGTGVPEVMSPDMTLSSVPTAIMAESVQGLDRDKLAEFGTHIDANMTPANLLTLFDGSDASAIHNHDGRYALLSGSSSIVMGAGQTIELGEVAGTPGGLGAADAGKVWIDTSDSNKMKYWDGTGVVDLTAGGGGAVADVFGRTGNVVAATSDYDAVQIDNTPAGDIAATDVQAAIDELDTEKLSLAGGTMTGPIAMGTSKITGLGDGAAAQDAATMNNISSAITANNASYVAKAGDVMTGALELNDSSQLRLHDDAGTEYVSFQAPNGLAGNVDYTLPPDDGNLGDVLRTDGSGVLTWVAQSSGADNLGDHTATQVLELVNGTAALPSMTFDSDLDTGISRVNADQMIFSAGGAGVMTVDTGNVAISTYLYSPEVQITAGSTNGYTFVGDTDTMFYSSAADTLNLRTGGTDRLTVNSTGTVSLNGTGSYLNYQPNGTECGNNEVLKWDDTNDRWICGTDNTGGGSGTLDQAYDAGAATVTVDGTGGGDVVWNLTSTNDFKVQDNGTDVLIVDNQGHVGVGLTPVAVPGGASLQADGMLVSMSGTMGILNTTTDYVATTTGTAVNIRTGTATGDTYGLIQALDGGGTAPADLIFNESGANVGIGADTTPDHTLDVDGNIGISAGGYLNFGDTTGSGGYGIRDASGNIEYKNNSGAWATLDSLGVSGTLDEAYDAGAATVTVDGTGGGDVVWNLTSTNVFKVQDGGVDAFVVDDSGNVGIGTNAPRTDLHVQKTTGSTFRLSGANDNTGTSIEFEENGGSTDLLVDGYGMYIKYEGADNEIRFAGVNAGAVSDDLFVVERSGNVGIGLTAPLSPLHVFGSGPIRQTSTDQGVAGGGAIVQGLLDPDNSFARAFFGHNGVWDDTANLWNVDNIGANDSTGIVIPNGGGFYFVQHSTTGATARTFTHANYLAGAKMVIDTSGDVGIGTATPSSKLHVEAGEFQLTGAGAYFNYQPNNTECANNEVLKWDDTNDRWICGTDNTGGGSGTLDQAYDAGAATVTVDGTGGGDVVWNLTSTNVFKVQDGGVDAFVVDDSGNIGIGTSNPRTEYGTGMGTAPLYTTLSSDGATQTSPSILGLSNPVASPDGTATAGSIQALLAGQGTTPNSRRIAIVGFGADGSTAGAYGGYIHFAVKADNDNASGPAEAMRIVESGNVGIGTSSPTSKLDLNGALNVQEMAAPAVSASGDGRIYFDSTAKKFRVSEDNGAYVDLVTAAGAPTTIDMIAGSGLTGGGTLAADRTFNVIGGDGITANADDIEVDIDGLTAETTPDGAADTVMIYDSSATALRKMTINNLTSLVGGNQNLAQVYDQGTNTVPVTDADGDVIWNLTEASDFKIQDNGTDAFVVTDGGLVGVGTAAPGSPLTVAGAGGSPLIDVRGSDDSSIWITSAGTADYPYMVFRQGATAQYEIGVTGTVDPAGGDLFYISNNPQNGSVGANFAINASGSVGIGTTTPSGNLHIEDESGAAVFVDAYGAAGAPQIRGGRAGGTVASPTAVSGNDVLFSVRGRGYDGSAWSGTQAKVDLEADETWSGSANGARISFSVTENGTTTMSEAMRIDHNGNVGIGTANPDDTALLDISSTTKGFLPPRMTTTERDNISSPPDGLTVYNTTTDKLNIVASGAWTEVGGAGFGSGNSGYVGSLSYTGATNCSWAQANNNYTTFNTVDSDCNAPSVDGAASAPDEGKIPAIKFASLPAGRYQVMVNAYMNASTGGRCYFRLYDGTNTAGYIPLNNSTANRTPYLIGDFSYTTAQTNITFYIQSADDNTGADCTISLSDATYRDFKMSVIRIDGQGTAVQVADDDGDTSVQSEASADEDILRFNTAGTERMNIDASGNVNVSGGFVPTGTVDLTGATLTDNAISVDDLDFASAAAGINIPSLGSEPTGATAGQMYYNTGSDKLFVYDGTSTWSEVGSGGGGTYGTGNSGFVGSVQYAPTASCWWIRSSTTSWGNVPSEAACNTATATGAASAPGGKYPGITFASLPAGRYRIRITGTLFWAGTGAECTYSWWDGSNLSGITYASDKGGTTSLEAEYEYSTPQTSITFRLRSKTSSGTHNCEVYGDTGYTNGPVITVERIDGNTSAIMLADDDGDTGINAEESTDEDKLRFDTAGSERMLIDENGYVAFGGIDTAATLDGSVSRFTIAGNPDQWMTRLAGHSANASYPGIAFSKSRNATIDAHTIVNNGDIIGALDFYGSDGTDYELAASIYAMVDGAPGNDDLPGALSFRTTLDGASAPQERMRIDNQGRVGIGTATPGAMLDISQSVTATTAGNTSGVYHELSLAPGSNSSHITTADYTRVHVPNTVSADFGGGDYIYGVYGEIEVEGTGTHEGTAPIAGYAVNSGTGTVNWLGAGYLSAHNTGGSSDYIVGAYAEAVNSSSNLSAELYGTESYAYVESGGDATDAYGIYGNASATGAGSTLTNAYGGYFDARTSSGGSIGTGYGVYIGTIDGTTQYSLYSSDAGAAAHFAGEVRAMNGLRLGTSSSTTDGTLRWDGSDLQVYDSGWQTVSTGGGASNTLDDAYNAGAATVTVDGTGGGDVVWNITGSNSFKVQDGGTDAFVVDSDGQVGIGTSTPGMELEIQGTSPTVFLTGSDAANLWQKSDHATQHAVYGLIRSQGGAALSSGKALGVMQFMGDSGGSGWQTGASIRAESASTFSASNSESNLMFETTANGSNSPTERMRIQSDGNVGIGTSSAATSLVVAKSGSPTIHIGQQQGSPSWAAIYLGSTYNFGSYNFSSDGTDIWHNRPTGGDIVFAENDSSQMILEAGGEFGIGIGAPALKFHVADGASGYAGAYNSRSVAVFEGDEANGAMVNIMSKNTGIAGLFLGDEDAVDRGQVYYNNATDSMWITTQGGTHNMVYGSGNLGVGTTSPTSTLDLNGALTAQEMAAPAVSASGDGRIYFDSTSKTFKVSEDGGAYIDLVGATSIPTTSGAPAGTECDSTAEYGNQKLDATTGIMYICIANGWAQTKLNAGCGGTLVGGYCWYYGPTGESCTEVCDSNGGYNLATETYVGSAGSTGNCQTVMNALSVPGGGVTTSGTDTEAGCAYSTGWGTRYRFNDSPTSAEGFASDLRRVCACNE